MGIDGDQNTSRVRTIIACGAATLLVACAIIAGRVWYLTNVSLPSTAQRSREVAALETHVLPVVEELKATWYLNEGPRTGSIRWERGSFTEDSRAASDGDDLFDNETQASYERFSQAIRVSGVPTNRLSEAEFAADGSLRFASFRRSGGGLRFVFTYIYSPGEKPAEWKSPLGPVVLTRIGDSDWWLEQSPND